MSHQQWHLMNAAGEPPRAAFESAGRARDLGGKTVGLLWNGKPGGDLLLDEVGQSLCERFLGLDIVKFWETRPATRTAYGTSADDLRFVAENADLVIGANAD